MCDGVFLRKFNGYIWSNFKSDEECARITHISPKLLNEYLSGELEPDFAFLKILANLGCDMNWLFKKF